MPLLRSVRADRSVNDSKMSKNHNATLRFPRTAQDRFPLDNLLPDLAQKPDGIVCESELYLRWPLSVRDIFIERFHFFSDFLPAEYSCDHFPTISREFVSKLVIR